jgi:hypothetical protein
MTKRESLFKQINAKSIEAMLPFPINGSTVNPFNNEGKEDRLATIINARLLNESDAPCFDREGFAIYSNGFTSTEILAALQENNSYQPLNEFMISYFLAQDILNLGFVVRDELAEKQSLDASRPPAALLHSDWNAMRINKLGKQLDPFIITNPDLTNESIAKFIDGSESWSIVNVWMPLSLEVNCPLVLCDQSSINKKDIISDLKFQNVDEDRDTNDGDFLSLDLNKTYRWFYYPLMQTNEMLIFNQYDSKQGANDFIPVFHTAINLVEEKELINRARRSIEIRFVIKHK